MTKLLDVVKTTDLTDTELEKIQKYTDEGLPGIADVTNHQIHRMLDLYLTGSTYTQIAASLALKKVVVLYLAHKYHWYQDKQEYLNEVQEKIKSRVVETKLRNSEFVLLTIQAYQKRIANKLTRYLATNDEAHMDEVDLKELNQLMKAIEMIGDLDSMGRNSQGKSPVSLNLGNGVTVEKDGDNKVIITPNDITIGETLKQFADNKREEEKRKLEKKKHDIEVLKGEKE